MSENYKSDDKLMQKLAETNGLAEPAMPESGIGERMKSRRKDLGLSVEKLCELTALFDHEAKYVEGSGISRATLYSYESGSSRPGAREMRILCEALNVSPSVLLLGQEWDKDMARMADVGARFLGLVELCCTPQFSGDTNESRNMAFETKLKRVLGK